MQFYIFSDMSEREFSRADQAEKYCNENDCSIIHSYIAACPKIAYSYHFEDGNKMKLNPIQAKIYCHLFDTSIKTGGPLKYNRRDIYEGFNPGLGVEVRGKTHHNQLLKERGLIEAGSGPCLKQEKIGNNSCVTDSMIKAAVDAGANIGSVAADALKNGIKLHKE